jgi:hypothetical protein
MTGACVPREKGAENMQSDTTPEVTRPEWLNSRADEVVETEGGLILVYYDTVGRVEWSAFLDMG